MQMQENTALAQYTSFNCGGKAERLLLCNSPVELIQQVENVTLPLWILGYGTNSLISDTGLPGTTFICRGGALEVNGNEIIADAGAWWDDMVVKSIESNLWGIELMSGIPSSVGGAIVGNIAAYGQQISDCLSWVEVLDSKTHVVKKLRPEELNFSYRSSSLQHAPELLVLRAAFTLSNSVTTDLAYGSALRIATEKGLTTDTLTNRRTIIMEARGRAGSLYNPSEQNSSYTAGSFFKNPLVDLAQAKQIVAFDETGKSTELLLKQNEIHGGDEQRISAAHVLLAAGFKRGQTWGKVRLHPDHVLKIENMGGALSQEIYDVAQEIISTVQDKLKITLEPEVRFLGKFDQQ